MSDALLLFPHQLFRSNDALARHKSVWLVEDPLYFKQYPFHKSKLVLHRASMRGHARALQARGHHVVYVDSAHAPDLATVLARMVSGESPGVHDGAIRRLHYIDPVDDWAEQALSCAAVKLRLPVVRHDSPMFLTPQGFLHEQFDQHRHWSMATFYAAQRKRMGVLVEQGKPVGGRWSFDSENRKRLPKGLVVPAISPAPRHREVDEAIDYVEREFPGNPGNARSFAYPTTNRDARRWLAEFVDQRLRMFGDFEDAMAADQSFLFHSVLTPMLNTGLLTPDEVLDHVLGAPGIPLNAREGFVRQLIGWREFIRASYILRGRTQRSRNFWRHERPLPDAFWGGTTGIAPVDTVIHRVLDQAYAHHIERLMILANFMQLCGIRPDDVYRWFMALFIDAYDWVMVPNVYGMALHADGGLITTKPYVSGSNYVLKMSDFKRGPWCDKWDALFWTFIARHRAFFDGNPRLALMARQLDRAGAAKERERAALAATFLASLA